MLQRPERLVALVGLVGMAWATVGCQESAVSGALPPECGDPLSTILRPSPMPSVVPTLEYGDDSLEGATGVVFDPRPLGRGEHAVQRWWLDETHCEVVGGDYGWGPPPPAAPDDAAPAPEQTAPDDGWSRIRALVITGPDPGAAADARRWMTTFDRLGAVGFHVASPSRTSLEATVDALCEDVQSAAITVLVTTGRAARTHAGDAFLVGGHEAVSWAAIGDRYLTGCAAAGLRIWVVDAAFAPQLAELAGADAAPTLLWQASSAERPDAPRTEPAGGGLLTLALTERVDAEAGSACLSTQIARTRDLWSAFGDEAAVVAEMRADRWARYGAPALAEALSTGDAVDPLLSGRIAADVTADLPPSPLQRAGGEPTARACEEDADCDEIDAACSPGACRRMRCTDDGLCRPGPDVDAPCDDGSICTQSDRCDDLGLCRGDLIVCDDGNACTIDTCVYDLGCVASPIPPGQPCDDGQLCTLDDRCDDAGGCIGDLVDCDDGDGCTTDICNPSSGCVHAAAVGPCDDGDACTHQDFCVDALCRGAPLPCQDGLDCTSSACDPATGCLFEPLADGIGCDDGDGCTVEDRCFGGACVGTTTVCDDGHDCTLDLCDDGGCVHLPAPGTCVTAAGCVAVGEPPLDAPCMLCVATGVVEAAPGSEGAPCPDDGVFCTDDVCQDGVCRHPDMPGYCHDGDGVCFPVGGLIEPCLQCVATGVAAMATSGAVCDDGDPCTVDDTCTVDAVCGGTKLSCCSPDPISACGDTIWGDTSVDPQAAPIIDDWACLTSLQFLSAERSHAFEAPCDGIVTFQFAGVPGLLLFVTPGELNDDASAEAACADATCDGYSAGPASRLMSQGQRFVVTVDGNSGAHGAYSIDVECACNEEPEP